MCKERSQKRGPRCFRSKEERPWASGPDGREEGREEELGGASLAGSHMGHTRKGLNKLFLINKRGRRGCGGYEVHFKAISPPLLSPLGGCRETVSHHLLGSDEGDTPAS